MGQVFYLKHHRVANGVQPESIMPKSPGVNLRQVWARMASQFIAKSEAALAWDGTAIWIVQDALADYIRTQTSLPSDQLHSPRWGPGEVNLIVSNLSDNAELYFGPIRPTNSSRACWLEIFGVPHIPTTEFLMSKLDKIDPLVGLTVP